MKFKIKKLDIQDVFLVYGRNRSLDDDTGYFEEIYNQSHFENLINHDSWNQVNVSYSKQDVLRGLYVSNCSQYIQCITGELYIVIVDLRSELSTFMKWQGVWLNADSIEQVHLYIPKYCAHGFYCKKDSHLLYLQDRADNIDFNIELNPFDTTISIEWPRPVNEYILSDKDKASPSFNQIRPRLLSLHAQKTIIYSNKTLFLIYTDNEYLSNYAIKLLKNKSKQVLIGSARLENRESLETEIKTVNPSHIICFSNFLENETNQVETIRNDLMCQLNLADVSSNLNINCTFITNGSIYKYDLKHSVNSGLGYTEEDEPNLNENFNSKLIIIRDKLLRSYSNVLNLRISNPISSDLNPKSFMTKLISSKNVENIPISIASIDDLWPIMIDMTEKKIVGTFNFNNPGTISNEDILKMYKNSIDNSIEWKIIESSCTTPASELNVDKLLSLGYKISNAKESIYNLIKKLKDECFFKPKNILLTGGAGFIGSHVAIHLVKKYQDYKIVVLDILDSCSNIKNLDEIKNESNFKFIQGDICDYEFVKSIFENYEIDCVLHFAALSHVGLSIKHFLKFTDVNVKGTHVLLENAVQFNVKRFVHVSTDEVYGTTDEIPRADQPINPTNPYACTKVAAENIILAYQKCFKLPIVITRSNNCYGPHQYLEKVIPKFIQRLILNKKCCVYGNGLYERDFLYISDFVNAFDIVLHRGEINSFYNIGSNSVINIKDLAIKIIRLMNKTEYGKENDMIEFVEERVMDDLRYRIECTPIKQLGWLQKIDFEEGLKKTIEWFIKNPNYWSSKPDYDESVLDPHP